MGSVDALQTDGLDVIVVGAGFSGLYALHQFRRLGLKCKIYEAGADVGGVWYWNRYPGARVDSEWPFYQLSIPDVWTDFDFEERFPDHREIRRYFAHAVNVLDLRKDIVFNAKVNSAKWSKSDELWSITTESGHKASGKYIFLCTGLLHRQYTPKFQGISTFRGKIYHSSLWPEDLDLKGKRVCVVGAGATGIQLVQELSKVASQLTLVMRRPSYCLPIGNRKLSVPEQDGMKPMFPALFREGRKSAGGLPIAPAKGSIHSLTPDALDKYYSLLYRGGSFGFGAGNFPQIYTDMKANRMAYDWWAKRTRMRLQDPKKRELLIPEVPPFPFLTRRCPLETDFYEMVDQPHVDVISVLQDPIETFTEAGIRFASGLEKDFDMVVMATGYESFSGSVSNMGLENKDGQNIKDLWSNQGIETYLGLLIHSFPNCFMSYSPQAPTTLSNGPTILEAQVDWVVDAIKKLEKEGRRTIEPTKEAQAEWCESIDKMCENTLFPLTPSWWTGGNIPGKKIQMLTHIGGIPAYEAACRATLDDWKGFDVQ